MHRRYPFTTIVPIVLYCTVLTATVACRTKVWPKEALFLFSFGQTGSHGPLEVGRTCRVSFFVGYINAISVS